MQATNNAKMLIKSFEGLKLKAYTCPVGVLTIGYGHTGGVREGQTITLQQAEDLLDDDLREYARVLEQILNASEVHINQNQFDALLDFVYNLGTGNLLKSTLLKLLQDNAPDAEVAAEFKKWNKARVNGKLTELPGLTRRREAEKNLYLTPVYVSDV